MRTRYVVVDLEMTGLNAAKDRILEIGALRVVDHKVEETFETLIDPHRKLDPVVVQLTGITEEMAAGGMEADDAVNAFLKFAGDDILVGHNLIADYSFLKQNVVNQKKKWERSGVDTLLLARKYLPGELKKDLNSLCQYYEISQDHCHRALEDARVTGLLLEKMMEEYGTEEVFVPHPLQYKAKKQTPITKVQKNYLNQLAEYHRIELNADLDSLTRNEASRLTDKIISKYGRLEKRM